MGLCFFIQILWVHPHLSTLPQAQLLITVRRLNEALCEFHTKPPCVNASIHTDTCLNILLDLMNVDTCLNMLLVCRKLIIPYTIDDYEVATLVEPRLHCGVLFIFC